MKKHLVINILLSIVLIIIAYTVAVLTLCDGSKCAIFCTELKAFEGFYASNIRGHLFAGLLALGGFLLSLKTFIVVNMKENVYDNPGYIEKWKKMNKHKSDLTLYGPLRQLSDLLFYAIAASIFAAVAQMTIGLYEHWVAALFCCWAALLSLCLIVDCLIVIKRNLDSWFDAIG